MTKKFGLLIGNGFTLDFSLNKGLDSLKPFRNFNNPNISYDRFLKYLPDIQNELYALSQDYSDFDAIKIFLESIQDDISKDCQLRRFLSLAYSEFQLEIDKFNINDWKWLHWLDHNRSDLSYAISFNYDVLLERVLKSINVQFYRPGTTESFRKVPLIKPHGSIDFDFPDRFISHSILERWTIHTKLNDAQTVKVIPKWEWILPRFEPDIVPPSQDNYQLGLSWVEKGNQTLKNLLDNKQVDNLIIIGHSYSSPDRPEVKEYITQLKNKTNIYICDINPSKDLIDFVRSKGHELKEPNELGLPW